MQGCKEVQAHFFGMSLSFMHFFNLFVGDAQTDGLLKWSNQVELSFCKCSPSGVSHFQGPQEHMRHSCETGRRKEKVAIRNSFERVHFVEHI